MMNYSLLNAYSTLADYAEGKVVIEASDKEAILKLAEDGVDSNLNEIRDSFTRIITAPYATKVIREFLPVIALITKEFMVMKGFDQKSVYHNLDVLEHTLAVLDGIPLEADNRRDAILSYAALYHDSGKPEAFKFNNGQGHMKDHPFISCRIFGQAALLLGLDEETCYVVDRLISYHDEYYEVSEATVRDFVNKVTPEIMGKLLILQHADIMAHSEVGRGRLSIWERISSIYNDML